MHIISNLESYGRDPTHLQRGNKQVIDKGLGIWMTSVFSTSHGNLEGNRAKPSRFWRKMISKLEFGGHPDGHRRVWVEERCFQTCTVSHLCVYQRWGSKPRNRKMCGRQRGLRHGRAGGGLPRVLGSKGWACLQPGKRQRLPAEQRVGVHTAQHGRYGFPKLGVPLLQCSLLHMQVIPGLASLPCANWGLGNWCKTNKQKTQSKKAEQDLGLGLLQFYRFNSFRWVIHCEVKSWGLDFFYF